MDKLMNKQDFSTAEIGQKLWSIQLGECEVLEIDDSMIRCKTFEEEYYDTHNFHINGKNYFDDKFPSLFWSNPQIVIPEKPKRKVKKEVTLIGDRYDEQIVFTLNEEVREEMNDNKLYKVSIVLTYEVEE